MGYGKYTDEEVGQIVNGLSCIRAMQEVNNGMNEIEAIMTVKMPVMQALQMSIRDRTLGKDARDMLTTCMDIQAKRIADGAVANSADEHIENHLAEINAIFA